MRDRKNSKGRDNCNNLARHNTAEATICCERHLTFQRNMSSYE